MIYDNTRCTLCPRRCMANRVTGRGRCGAGNMIKIAAAMPHMWEEPCISGDKGSGAIFFSGCQLGCVFCQNRDISILNYGKEIDSERFAEICFELREKEVHNISLVSADQYLPYILPVLVSIKSTLGLPIVYNCSGYQSAETLSMLCGIADIYLPDIKFLSPELSRKYTCAEDYFEVASRAVSEMVRQTGKYRLDEKGIMKSGTLVRHLVIPECRKDSLEIVRWLSETFSPEDIILSVMSQYTPTGSVQAPARRLTSFEYESVCKAVREAGFRGYFQDISGADASYIPDFHLQGVTKG